MNCEPLLLLIPLAFVIDVALAVYVYLSLPRYIEEREAKKKRKELSDFLAKLREDYESDVDVGGTWETWDTNWDRFAN